MRDSAQGAISEEDRIRLFGLLQKILGLDGTSVPHPSSVSDVSDVSGVTKGGEKSTVGEPADAGAQGRTLTDEVDSLIVKDVSDEELADIDAEREAKAVPAQKSAQGNMTDGPDGLSVDLDDNAGTASDPVEKANLEDEMDGADYVAELNDTLEEQAEISEELADDAAKAIMDEPPSSEEDQTVDYGSIMPDDKGDDMAENAQKALMNSDLAFAFGGADKVPPNLLRQIAEGKGLDISLFHADIIYSDEVLSDDEGASMVPVQQAADVSAGDEAPEASDILNAQSVSDLPKEVVQSEEPEVSDTDEASEGQEAPDVSDVSDVDEADDKDGFVFTEADAEASVHGASSDAVLPDGYDADFMRDMLAEDDDYESEEDFDEDDEVTGISVDDSDEMWDNLDAIISSEEYGSAPRSKFDDAAEDFSEQEAFRNRD